MKRLSFICFFVAGLSSYGMAQSKTSTSKHIILERVTTPTENSVNLDTKKSGSAPLNTKKKLEKEPIKVLNSSKSPRILVAISNDTDH